MTFLTSYASLDGKIRIHTKYVHNTKKTGFSVFLV